uniref:Photosystem II extrinsic protein V n=1 Tax=Polysiphonia scopulorum TaxID=257860 RepID=A0A1Z1MID3_9FLOR|nr:photosystem II cytochrome c550 [Polysiphonia scopulorum]ARW65501.1 photosystem II cytochrome c550 [Polysiphonia scopulorum]
MIKKNIALLFSVVTLLFSSAVVPAYSIELDEATRTVTLDSSSKTITLTPEQVKRGKRLFNNSCAQCHNGGITKTNPNIGLELESLSLATPARDNVMSLVDYMKDPLSYDGQNSIAELHPSIKSAEIFPKMKNLTDEDLFSMAGYILLQPRVAQEKWGGGKIYY